jgi:hypothetical protein
MNNVKPKSGLWKILPRFLSERSAHAVFPNIYLPQKLYENFTRGDVDFTLSKVLAHEQTHLDRQKLMGPIVWYVRYIFSPKFRFHEELRAIESEMRIELARGEEIRIKKRAKQLSGSTYLWMTDYETAYAELQDILIRERISELNKILDTDFDLGTWSNKNGIAFIHYQNAWKNITNSLTEIVKLDDQNKGKFAKKIRKSDEYRKSRELAGEIIVASMFIDYSPQFEIKVNGLKDVDMFIELDTGIRISIEVTTINLVPEVEREKIRNTNLQREDGKMRVTSYFDISYKRIKTAYREKMEKFNNDDGHYNFLLLYNVANANNQDLTNAFIGKYSFLFNPESNDLGDPAITEKGIWLDRDLDSSRLDAVCLFEWNLSNLSILYNPSKEVPNEVKSVFKDFVEVTETEKI